MGASQDAQFSEARSRHAIDLMEGGRRKCVYFDRRRPNGYSLSRPVEGLSGPRQYPFALLRLPQARRPGRTFAVLIARPSI